MGQAGPVQEEQASLEPKWNQTAETLNTIGGRATFKLITRENSKGAKKNSVRDSSTLCKDNEVVRKQHDGMQ